MEKIKWSEKVTNEKAFKRREEDTSKQYSTYKSKLDWSYSEKKLPSSCRTDDRNERSRKKKNNSLMI